MMLDPTLTNILGVAALVFGASCILGYKRAAERAAAHGTVYSKVAGQEVQDTQETTSQSSCTCAPIQTLGRMLSSQNTARDRKHDVLDQQKLVLCAPESKGESEAPEDEPDRERVILRVVFDAEQEEERSPLGVQGSDQGSGICHL